MFDSPIEEHISLTALHLLDIHLCDILIIELIPALIDVVQGIRCVVTTWNKIKEG